MPNINHGTQFGKNSVGHANWPDDDWNNFLYKNHLACSGDCGSYLVVVCFIEGLHFRLVTLYFGDIKRVKYKPQLNFGSI